MLIAARSPYIHGNGNKRREAGMDQWGMERAAALAGLPAQIPVGPLFCVIDGRRAAAR